VEAYLSQVEMAQTKWKPRPSFDYGEQWVDVFAKTALRELHRFLTGAQRYHRRIVLYRRFTREPRNEVRRLMAAFPYSFEPSQLDLRTKNNPAVGDPSAWASKEVSEKNASDRGVQFEKFVSDFGHLTPADTLLKLHNAIGQWSDDPYAEDGFIWDELERLIRMELVRNGMSIY
jgi:hypothetical protein